MNRFDTSIVRFVSGPTSIVRFVSGPTSIVVFRPTRRIMLGRYKSSSSSSSSSYKIYNGSCFRDFNWTSIERKIDIIKIVAFAGYLNRRTRRYLLQKILFAGYLNVTIEKYLLQNVSLARNVIVQTGKYLLQHYTIYIAIGVGIGMCGYFLYSTYGKDFRFPSKEEAITCLIKQKAVASLVLSVSLAIALATLAHSSRSQSKLPLFDGYYRQMTWSANTAFNCPSTSVSDNSSMIVVQEAERFPVKKMKRLTHTEILWAHRASRQKKHARGLTGLAALPKNAFKFCTSNFDIKVDGDNMLYPLRQGNMSMSGKWNINAEVSTKKGPTLLGTKVQAGYQLNYSKDTWYRPAHVHIVRNRITHTLFTDFNVNVPILPLHSIRLSTPNLSRAIRVRIRPSLFFNIKPPYKGGKARIDIGCEIYNGYKLAASFDIK